MLVCCFAVALIAAVPVCRSGSYAANAIWVEPSTFVVDFSVGNKFNVTVWTNLSVSSFVWEIGLRFNEAYLNAVRAGYTADGKSGFFSGHFTIPVTPIIDNTTGIVHYCESLVGSDSRAAGSGSLCWIEFQVVAKTSNTTLSLDAVDTYVLDPDLNDIQLTRYDATVVDVGAGPIWLEPSIIPLMGKTAGYKFNVTAWINLNTPSFTWAVKCTFNGAVFRVTRAGYTAGGTSQFFSGHSTVPVVPVIGVGWVAHGETLVGGSRSAGSGSLCWFEFEVIVVSTVEQLSIDNEDTYVLDPYLSTLAIAKYGAVASWNVIGNLGNLRAVSIEPVQVVWGVDLVQDKATDFRIGYESTFDVIVETDIRLETPGFDPNSYQFKYKFAPGNYSFVISSVQSSSPFFLARTKPEATFKFSIDPDNLIVETDETDNTFPRADFANRRLVDTRRLNILFVAVRFDGEDGYPGYFNGFGRTDFVEHAVESVNYLKATYPVAESELSYYVNCFNAPVNAGPRPTTEAEAARTFLDLIRRLALGAGSYCDRVVGVVRAGWFDGIPNDWDRTLGYSGGSPAAVVVSLGYWKTTPHEIGHTYSLGHSNYDGAGYYVVGRSSVNAQTFMSTGAITDPPVEPRYRMPVPSFWIRSTEYQTLLSTLTDRADPEILLVSPTFWRNGTVELGDSYRFPTGMPNFEEGDVGNYFIVQKDVGGNVLSVVGFNVTFADELHGRSFERVPLAFTILFAEGTKTVQILNITGHIVASKVISEHDPAVHLISPNGGEILTSDHVQVSWEASDLDGDPIVYALLVSSDEGVTWNPVETGLKQTTYDLPLTGFSGGNNYIIKVIASDGANTAEDTSDGPFTIASFTLDVVTPSQNVPVGSRANYTLNITSYGGFSSPIILNATSSTTDELVFRWINGSVILPVPNGSIEAILEVEVPDVAEGGSHTVILSGTSGNNTEVAIAYLFASSHDLAISRMTPSKTVVGQGFSMTVNVTVDNQGNFGEAFTVSLYGSQTLILQGSTYLSSRNSTTVTLTWNTSGFAKGNYTVWAYAEPVLGETNTADNTFTSGLVTVAMVGDITGKTPNLLDFIPDGKVNMKDIGLVAKYFGQTVPPAPSNCDLTGPIMGVPDGIVNMRDIGLVARHFGETDP